MQREWTIDDFELGRPLGKGRFGQVWLARDRIYKNIVAVKIIPKDQVSTFELAKQLRRELEIHSKLDHPNVVQMYGHFHDQKHVYLILEYCGNGEVYSLLETQIKFSEKTAANFIFQVTKAIVYLHKYNVIHRDIKPENLLLSFDNKIKISDLGWAVKNKDKRRLTYCGTPQYLAPEMYNKSNHDKSIDLWCLGILTYEFLYGEPPFNCKNKSTSEMYEMVKNLNYTLPEYFSLEVQDFIRKLLQVNIVDRMKAEEVFNHPWIVKYCKKE